MNIDKKKLRKKASGDNYQEGYRIVYLYDDDYEIGEYCKTIEGFMIGFAENAPILDDDDIPDFVSTEDLLNRYLNNIEDISGVALYNIDGDCIDKVYREKNKRKK